MNTEHHIFRLMGAVVLATATAAATVAEPPASVTRAQPVLEQPAADPIAVQEQSPNRRVRDHPVQAPTIPHAIKGYSINRDFNQCLSCHDRPIAPLVKAPAVAVSHFRNRDGEYLVNISPRQYFCTQCHVPQTVAQ